ncbi:hypothetical protein H0X06_01345 [Candidatus Dependentiae bacterium]|nr:hypothetical protein [Candidatus Dependentiae bacterium]
MMKKYIALGLLSVFTIASSVQAGKKNTVGSTFESVTSNVAEKFHLLVSTVMPSRSEKLKKDTLISAVEDTNVKLVEKFLKREGIADENSKKLLLETAEDVVEQREESVSLLRSGWDCARFAGWSTWIGLGSFMCLAGTVFAVVPQEERNGEEIPFSKDIERKAAVGVGLLGALCTVPGLYYLIKAWKCPTASTRLESARTIENLIKKASLSTKETDLQ